MSSEACTDKPIATVSKIYSDVLKDKPREHWDYDKFNPQYDDIENYSLTRRLGRGKYSEVFEAIDARTEEKCVVKVLKPVKKNKVKREIRVLEELNGNFNVVKLKAVVLAAPPHAALIFEHVNSVDFEKIYLTIAEFEMRYYIYELLKALNYCHSKGIMHRDVKPHNIIVDQSTMKLRLIDWGLAEFYHSGQEYNVRVASRYYKSPELLLGYGYYDYSLDMWSLGCTFASMIFRRDPFFKGSDNFDQLRKIVKVLGSDDLHIYTKKYNIKLTDGFEESLGKHTKKCWGQFIKTENEYLVNDDALDLLNQLLQYDHTARITAIEALEHRYFAPILAYKRNHQKKSVEEVRLKR